MTHRLFGQIRSQPEESIKTDIVVSNIYNQINEETNNPVHKLTTNKFNPRLIIVLIRSIFEQ